MNTCVPAGLEKKKNVFAEKTVHITIHLSLQTLGLCPFSLCPNCQFIFYSFATFEIHVQGYL